MKKIELIFVALITILGASSLAFEEGTADDQGPDQGLTVPTCGHINPSETHLLNSTVGLNVASASFILSWGDATDDLEMVLVTPSGMGIDPDAGEPITYQRDANLIYYIIPYPEPGSWTAEITAGAIPEMGEDYCAFTVLDEGEMVKGDETMSESPSDLRDDVQESEECAECNS